MPGVEVRSKKKWVYLHRVSLALLVSCAACQLHRMPAAPHVGSKGMGVVSARGSIGGTKFVFRAQHETFLLWDVAIKYVIGLLESHSRAYSSY